MTNAEVKKIFMLLKTAYSSFLPDSEEERKAKLTLWETMFVTNSYSECEWAAQRCIETCIYPPTIADMKQWLGTGRTLNDKQAMLPFHYEEPTYADETHMEAAFMRLMRDLNKAKPMVGNQPPTVQEKTEGR